MKIGGKDRAIAFTINALLELKNDHSIDILKGMNKDAFGPEEIRAIAFVGLKHGAKRDKTEFNETIEEVGDMLSLDSIAELMKSILGQSAKEGKTGE